MIVPVISASDKNHLTNVLGIYYAWPWYFTICNIRWDIHHIPTTHSWILIGLIPSLQTSTRYSDGAWHSTVRTVPSLHSNADITSPGLKWDCTDGFWRECYPLWAAWDGDYPEHVMVAQVLYGLYPMCEIHKGVPIGHWTISVLEYSTY